MKEKAKEPDTIRKNYDKALETAKTLPATLTAEIDEIRLEQGEFSRRLMAAQGNLKWCESQFTGTDLITQKERWGAQISHYKQEVSRCNIRINEKTLQKIIVEKTLADLTPSDKILDTSGSSSAKDLSDATQHLNAMIDLIDPPFFNPKKLLTALAALGVAVLGTLATFGSIGAAISASAIGVRLRGLVAEEDAKALPLQKHKGLFSEQKLPLDAEVDKSTIYFRQVRKQIQACWHENNGTEDGVIKRVTINDPKASQRITEIIKMIQSDIPKAEKHTYFNELASLLHYPSLKCQALNSLAEKMPGKSTEVTTWLPSNQFETLPAAKSEKQSGARAQPAQGPTPKTDPASNETETSSPPSLPGMRSGPGQ